MELGAGLARARPLGMGVAQRHFLASTRLLRQLSLNHAKMMVLRVPDPQRHRWPAAMQSFLGACRAPGELQVVGVAAHQKLPSAGAHLPTDVR